MRIIRFSIVTVIILIIAIFLKSNLSRCETCHGRIPYTSTWNLQCITGQLLTYYGDFTFSSYSEAIYLILTYNSNYEEQELALDDWNKKCEIIKAEAKSKAVKKEYDTFYYELVRVYSEDLGKWVLDWKPTTSTKVVEIIPDYELPDKPKLDYSEYYTALSAYCYLINDGLSPGEWDDLRTVILFISCMQKSDTYPAFDVTRAAESLVNREYITIAKKGKKSYEIKYTNEGLSYFQGLINRCWEFRQGLIEEAYSDDVISDDEYNKLIDANEKIKEELLKQLDKKKDWKWKTGGTFWSSNSKLPSGLLDAFKALDVQPEDIYSEGEFPYYRVLANIPVPIKLAY